MNVGVFQQVGAKRIIIGARDHDTNGIVTGNEGTPGFCDSSRSVGRNRLRVVKHDVRLGASCPQQ